MNNLNALRDEVYAINKANGWHEEKRTYGELIALVHSEVSEALEDYRNGKAVNKVWYEYKSYDNQGKPYIFTRMEEMLVGTPGKPCGIPSELADVVIRILDIFGLYGWDELEHYCDYHLPFAVDKERSFVEYLTILHESLSLSYMNRNSPGVCTHDLIDAIKTIEYICEQYNIDLESIIHQKLEYNKTRGYKHGGKVI